MGNKVVLNIFFDGAPRKSVLYILKDGEKINNGIKIEYPNDYASNDSLELEYLAFLKAIEYAPRDTHVNFLSDNQPLVAYMNSWKWIPSNKTQYRLHTKAKTLLEDKNITYRVYWCDRSFNYAG